MARLQTTVKCPVCGTERDVDVEALDGSGTVPENEECCNVCGTLFTVKATADVSVELKA